MSNSITIELYLTPIGARALERDFVNIEAITQLFQSQLMGRETAAVDEIIKAEAARATAAQEAIPTGREAIIEQAYARGSVKTMAQKNQEAEQALALNEPPATDQTEAYAQAVRSHALAMKISLVNATREDGKTDPVTVQALADIEARYARTIQAFLTDDRLGVDVSDQVPKIQRIRQGEAAFDMVDEAESDIIAEPDLDTPVHQDSRWPNLLAGS
ncbi:MAG: hypothetical protein AAF141_02775 [Pseudomonadota bacterium]